MDEEDFRGRLSSYFKLPDEESKKQAEEFKKLCTYVSGQYDQDEGFIELRKHIEEFENGPHKGLRRNRLFYLALPPSVFGDVAAHVKHNVYPSKEDGMARMIVEKPFGEDLDTSRALQQKIAPEWPEEEVYRIDHYLGKEMVKNLIYLRFNNQLFNAIWNKENIAAVRITLKEPFGTEGRGGYFDDIGIIRDVMQNHLLQVMTLVTMERPVSFTPEDIRDEKVKVLKAMPEIDVNDVVLGQYGKSVDGSKPAYTDDDTVPKGSNAVTFAAFPLTVENDRWSGVPFILSAGKALDEALVEVRIQFRPSISGAGPGVAPHNELVIRIQPNEAIYFTVNTKQPGFTNKVAVNQLDLSYKDKYKGARIPEAYEALILDALRADHSNFVRDDELDVSWKIFTPLLHHIDAKKAAVESYPYGSTGPDSLPKFLKAHGYLDDLASAEKANL